MNYVWRDENQKNTGGVNMVTLNETLKQVRSDTLPENTRYKDVGCDLSPSCLKCHLPLCKYDDPGWVKREKRISRDKKIYDLKMKGMLLEDLSKQFNVSSRTVHRIIKRKGYATGKSKNGEKPILALYELPNIIFYNNRGRGEPIKKNAPN
jgi:hypothetical protein